MQQPPPIAYLKPNEMAEMKLSEEKIQMEINKLLDQVENPLPELSESDYPSTSRKLFSNRKGKFPKKEEDDSLIAGVSDDALKLAAAELMEE